jgi:hypothetical protein
MNVQTLREPATAGEPVPRTQASALNIASERPRDLQKRRKRRLPVDVDNRFPGTSRHGIQFYSGAPTWPKQNSESEP